MWAPEALENRTLMAGDIAGAVFNDLNANGINDTTDPSLAGWTVFADTNSDGQFTPGEPNTVTDVKGKYTIVGLPAVATTVYDIPQSGFKPTPGFTDHKTITVRDGRAVKVDFPNVTAPITTGRIVGTVFEDPNENLIKESGEHGLQGWTLFVDTNGDGGLTAGEPTAISDTDGDYAFNDILAGSATVYEIPQGGFAPISGGLFPTVSASDHHVVNVVAGRSVRTDFANLIPPMGTIQGNVWNDANGDGIHQASESASIGRTVYIDLDNNGIQDATDPSRVTDANGAYAFAGIHAGSYRVVDILPAGFITADNRPSATTINVFTGSMTTLDFYNLTPATGSVAGVLWNDLDGNGSQSPTEPGLAGWQVYADLNFNGAFDAGDFGTTTDADGAYSIAGIAYGNVTIREIVHSTWVSTNPIAGAASTHLLNGENRTGMSFGNRERIGTIQGTVWNDANGDRARGVTETGLADWTVYLDMNSDGIQDASETTTHTDATGGYVFTRVPVGSYRVTEVLPAGWITAEGKPSTINTNLAIGGVNVSDFYNLTPVPGSISGTVWSDLDSNGVMAAIEPGIEGWQVYVDFNANGTLDSGDPQATTDATGSYTISNVSYGTTTIREILPAGFTATNSASRTSLVLNGENRTGVNFGIHEPTDFVISGVAFNDQNKDGVRDPSEVGVSGITVYLDTNNNGILDPAEPTTITSVDLFYTPAVNEIGTYSFTHLIRGTYHVRELVPAALEGTPAAVREQVVTIGPTSQLNVNFANVYRPNEIHGVVFDDTNANHIHDANEYARPGVSVYIDLNRDDVYELGEPQTVTTADGSYAFLGLTPGAYVVREDQRTTAGPHTYPTTGGGILWPAGTSHPSIGNVTPTSITTSLANGETYRQTMSLTLPGTGTLTNLVDVFLLFDDTGSFTSNSPIVRAAFPTIINSLQTSLPGIDLGFGVGRFEEYGNFASEFSAGRPFILNQPIVANSTAGSAAAIQSALDRVAPGYGGDLSETDIEALYQLVTGAGFDGNNNGTVSDSGAAGLASTQVTPGDSGDVPSFGSFTADAANGVLPASGNVGGGGFRTGALPIVLLATDTGFAYQPQGETSITGAGGITLPVSALLNSSRPTTPFNSGAGIQQTVTGLNALGALVIGLGTNPTPTLAPRSTLEALSQLTGAVNRSTTTIANGTPDAIAPGDPLYFQIGAGFGATVADGVVNAIQNAVTNVAMDITVRASDSRVQIINHTGTLLGIGAGQTASFDIEFVGDGRPHRFDLQFVREGTNVVLGSIPVVLGTPVVGEGYEYDELEDGEIHDSSHFGNYVANVAPNYVGGTDQTVTEDAGAHSIVAWATALSAGPATEVGQTLDFIATNDNPTLFSAQPTIAADGTLTFTPAPNASGSALVTVMLHDNGGAGPGGADTSAAQTFLITVTAVNDAPVGANDGYTATEGSNLAVAASGVLGNDIEADGDPLTAQLAVGPSHGTLTLNTDGSFLYTPAAGYFGNDSFTYVANDGSVDSNLATVNITVAAVNQAPVATDDLYATFEDSSLTASLPGVLRNDTDADADVLTATLVSGPTHGSLTLNADGSFLFVPSANFNGTDSFTYVANDGLQNSNVATVTLTVAAVNDAPTATDDSYTTDQGAAIKVTGPGILGNDADVDRDALTAALVAGPAHGTLTLNADGSFFYTPNSAFSGTDSFTYQANDGSLESNVATVTINVVRVNHAPTAADDNYATTEDTSSSSALPSVLSNDLDSDGDALTVALISGPVHGALTLNADGSFVYVPAANFQGTDYFTYKANDGLLDSNLATVAIMVGSVNDAPVATNDSFSATEDTALSVFLLGVLANDSDVDGDALTAAVLTGPAHGSLALNADGSFIYTPALNFNGTDSFTYKANDGALDSNIATVTITVAAVNDPPVAGNNSYNATEDTALSGALPGVLGNDTDVEGSPLTAIRVVGPSHGTVTLNANGSFLYTPALNFNGSDSFTYKANDGALDSNIATVTITVAAVIDVPVAGNDSYSTNQNSGLSVAALGVLLNDTDADGDPLSAVLATGPAHGSLVLNADGSFTYIPTLNYTGADSFTYRAADALSQSGLATVNITVVPVAPVTKFFVADTDRAATFQYTADGTAISNAALNKSDSKPRGIASNSSGTIQWVVDSNGSVFVYDNRGALLGQWQTNSVGKPEGITVWGNDMWFVDPTQDRVFFYAGGASLRTGKVNPTSSFALNSANLNSADLVTDGSHLWVVNDTVGLDKVFRYTTSGVMEGSWTISTTDPSPTGITIDPNSINHIWIVDASTDRVYQYDGATSRLTGSQEPSKSFALAPTNTNAQGIADPMPVSFAPASDFATSGRTSLSSSGASSSHASIDAFMESLAHASISSEGIHRTSHNSATAPRLQSEPAHRHTSASSFGARAGSRLTVDDSILDDIVPAMHSDQSDLNAVDRAFEGFIETGRLLHSRRFGV